MKPKKKKTKQLPSPDPVDVLLFQLARDFPHLPPIVIVDRAIRVVLSTDNDGSMAEQIAMRWNDNSSAVWRLIIIAQGLPQ